MKSTWIKRFACAVFAVCMIMTASIPAFAAEILPEGTMISEYAGNVKNCAVILFDETGEHVYEIDVAIPEGASKLEEEATCQNAILSLINPTARSAASTFANDSEDWISNEPFTITAQSTEKGGVLLYDGELNNSYESLIINFEDIVVSNGASRVNVRVENSVYPGGGNTYSTDTFGDSDFASIYMIVGRQYGDDDLRLSEGDNISIRASCNQGQFECKCTISATLAN